MSPQPTKRHRRHYALLAWLSLGVGGLGVVTPLLPTTPFVLVAAWAAAKGHPGLHRWLHEHPRFGRLLRQWAQERAIPVGAKRLAVGMILASWLLLFWLLDNLFVIGVTGLIMGSVAAYLLTRPAPRNDMHE